MAAARFAAYIPRMDLVFSRIEVFSQISDVLIPNTFWLKCDISINIRRYFTKVSIHDLHLFQAIILKQLLRALRMPSLILLFYLRVCCSAKNFDFLDPLSTIWHSENMLETIKNIVKLK